MNFGLLGAAVCMGIAALGSAIGIGIAGQGAIGAWKRCYVQFLLVLHLHKQFMVSYLCNQ